MKILILISLISCNRLLNPKEKTSQLEDVLSSFYTNDIKLANLELKYLKDIDMEIGKRGTLLHIACERENINLVKLVLQKGISTLKENYKGEKAIDITNNNEIKKLINFYTLREELLFAISKKESDVVELILKKDIDILRLSVKNQNIIEELDSFFKTTWKENIDLISMMLKYLMQSADVVYINFIKTAILPQIDEKDLSENEKNFINKLEAGHYG